MRKLWIVLSITGWLSAGILYYGGCQVTKQADLYAELAGTLDFKLQICQNEKSKAQSALQEPDCFDHYVYIKESSWN